MGTNQRRTTSTTSVQPRVRKGTKDGGKFAPILNPESSVQLVDHNVDADMDGVVETQRLARHFIRRYGLHDHTVNGYMDADHMTQDAVLAYLVASQTDRPTRGRRTAGRRARQEIDASGPRLRALSEQGRPLCHETARGIRFVGRAAGQLS